MRTVRVNVALGAALAAAALLTVRGAHAADAPVSSPAAATTHGEASTGGAASADPKEEKPEEKILRVNLDMVFGSARVNTVTGSIQPDAVPALGATGAGVTAQTSRVTNLSFVAEAGLKVTSGFALGLRLPLEGGVLFTNPSRSTGGVGNLELTGAGLINLASGVDLELTLGVTLPSAGGVATPTSAGDVPVIQGAIDQGNYDRYSLQRAISASRGFEDDELFQPNHLGINPKVRLSIGSAGKWHLDPWIKLDDLIATQSSDSFIGELIFGANLGVFLGPNVEPTLRIWANVPLTGADYNSAVAVVEPQLRFHFGGFQPYVGGILPIAGPISNPYAFGVRVGIGGQF